MIRKRRKKLLSVNIKRKCHPEKLLFLLPLNSGPEKLERNLASAFIHTVS